MSFFTRFFNKEKKEDLDKGLEKTKTSFLGKLSKAIAGKSTVDEEVLDELENVLITSDVGLDTTVKIIDLGSVTVAGITEITDPMAQPHILGTAQYTAPEYFLGELGTQRSDLFSLGIIAYQMLSGQLPYGAQVARATTRAAQRKLVYRSVRDDARSIPTWIDGALRKAVHPNPFKRYDALSEFIHDLRHPNPTFVSQGRPPLLERNPLLFWKGLSLLLVIALIATLVTHPMLHS